MFFIILIFFLPTLVSSCPNDTITAQDNYTCYKPFTTPAAWFEAEYNCAHLLGRLIVIPNVFENMYFNGMADEVFTNVKDFWIGGSLTSDSGWSWTDGTNLSFTNWDQGQPSSTTGQYCIAQQINNGKWYSYACNETRPYICRVPPYTGPQCPDGWIYIQFTKKCYYLTTIKRNWSNSTFYCEGLGGTLVSIHSVQENMVVSAVAYYYAQSSMSFWIGMHNPSLSGNWQWSDGSTVDYTYWSSQSTTYQFAYTQTTANSANYWSPDNEDDLAAMCQKPANVI